MLTDRLLQVDKSGVLSRQNLIDLAWIHLENTHIKALAYPSLERGKEFLDFT